MELFPIELNLDLPVLKAFLSLEYSQMVPNTYITHSNNI